MEIYKAVKVKEPTKADIVRLGYKERAKGIEYLTTKANLSKNGKSLIAFRADLFLHIDVEKTPDESSHLYFVTTYNKFLCFLSHHTDLLTEVQIEALKSRFKTLQIVNKRWYDGFEAREYPKLLTN